MNKPLMDIYHEAIQRHINNTRGNYTYASGLKAGLSAVERAVLRRERAKNRHKLTFSNTVKTIEAARVRNRNLNFKVGAKQ